ncbi:hypothetical protein [Sphingorhabdus sp. M41]|uniref:hypothetical protein n=1 Tax=Sphingorhabdus sp. M41 TaxID=1806885 RepID=UPI00078D6CA3|nr:hypothetical protein [Sphingorhabdus sp. M41]AMO71330.1 hypothetical protein AZE99_05160 [Sphingorhabdus sp. M41]
MPQTTRSIAITVSIMLLLTVATQSLYIVTLKGVGIIDGWPLRSTIWTTEILLFTGITVASLVGLVRSPAMQWGWAALVAAGLINIVQSGIGLSMFLPAAKAGPEFAPLMGTLLAGSFLFYNLAKAIIGLAALLFSLTLFRDDSKKIRVIGLITMIAGVIAIVLNMAAVRSGLGSVPFSGGSGAIATLFSGWAVWLSARPVE